ncbi:MAG: glycoside hydrolase family 3 N-terminal domain-containing protein [Janthinobacterium lividum]
MNIFRDPRWGRGQETYGEDLFLTTRTAVAFVTGMQGPDSDLPEVISTPKHCAVHSGPEPTRHMANIYVSTHDLEDTYLPAFRAAIVEGHAGSIMRAYNRIDGQPTCANDLLLKDHPRHLGARARSLSASLQLNSGVLLRRKRFGDRARR